MPILPLVLPLLEEISPSSRLLVGFSGGPDSTVLLHLLRRLSRFEVAAAHLDHAWRPESTREALALADWAQEEGLPFFWETLPATRNENEARKARYEALNRFARQWRADFLLLGHHADDQLETLLLRLTRGAALRGLRGIPFRREQEDGPPIIRPLLFVPKEEIRGYLSFHGLASLEDPTNESPEHARNRVRRLLPVLKEINPRAAALAARNARVLAEEDEFLESLVAPHWERLARTERGVSLPQGAMLRLPLVLRRRIVVRALREAGGSSGSFSGEHVERVLFALVEGGRVTLPSGLQAEVRQGALWIGRAGATEAVPFEPDGFEGFGWKIERMESLADPDSLDACRVLFDRDELPAELCWRHPLPDDRFRPWGHSRSRSLTHFFTRNRISPPVRSRALVLASGSEIYWVVGIRRSAQAPVSPCGERVFGLDAKPRP